MSAQVYPFNFPHFFSSHNSLTHRLRRSPLSQLGEGFQCIDFICKFDRFGVKQSFGSLLSPLGRSWLKAGWGVASIAQFQSVRSYSSNLTVILWDKENSPSELPKAGNPERQDFSNFCSKILPRMFSGLAVMHQNVPTFWSPPWVSFSKKHHRVERSLRAILSRWSKSS